MDKLYYEFLEKTGLPWWDVEPSTFYEYLKLYGMDKLVEMAKEYLEDDER